MHSHRYPVLAVLAAVLLGGPAAALPSPWGERLVKHKWNDIPDNWVTLGHPPNGTVIDLHIALKPHRENALIDALYEVSQPGNPKYGAHLTKEQVSELVAPHPDTLELVSSWIKHEGVQPSSISATPGGNWLTVTGVPVSQANQLLGATYQLYNHAWTNETILRTVGYALPTALHIHVQTIAPTTAFASTRLLQHSPRSRSGGAAAQAANATSGESVNMLSRRDRLIAPSFLRSVYKTAAYHPTEIDFNEIGIVGFEDAYPSQTDLVSFMAKFRDDAVTATFIPEPVNLHSNGFNPSLIADAETQYSIAIAFPTPVVFYNVGSSVSEILKSGMPGADDSYLQWLHYMIGLPSLPQTISVGHGTFESHIPTEYAEALCLMFGELGARGATVLAASGDIGVGQGDCKDSLGNVQFYTMFPASCPWVTSVGGTVGDPPYLEIANSLSGGGFSIHFTRPTYQQSAVDGYLRKLATDYAGYYNREGRGVPDIALQSSEYRVISGNARALASGTSCATSTAAGIVSLLNDFRMSRGEPPLGWLNPWLYQSGWSNYALNDITFGNNPGCGSIGFAAAAGWDPVTGLGSLNFQKLTMLLAVYPVPPRPPPPWQTWQPE